jgi:3-oxoadipate enol-lactonase
MTDGLLLIHAFPLDSRMWEQQRLGDRTVAPDLPGFGDAPPVEGGVMTMELAAAACIAALDAAGIGRAVVCGLSMGGYVALELWRTERERIAGLVLANTRPEADPPEGAQKRRDLAARLRTEGNVLADDPPPLLSDDAPKDVRRLVRAWIAEQSPEAIAAAALGMAERPDSTPDVARIDVPTLVITSDRDTLIPSTISAPMAEQIPGAEFALIEGAGHLSNLERPERFTELLRAHCERAGVAP